MRTDAEILHVRSSAGLYGAEYVLLGLIPALEQLGVASRLLCLDNPYLERQPLFDRANALGVPAQLVPCRGRFDFATIKTLREAMLQSPEAVVHVHDYKSALHVWLARVKLRRPIVATLHGRTATNLVLRLYESLETWLMRGFDRICIVSESMRRPLVEAGIAPGRISLIENGIDTERFAPDVLPWSRADMNIPHDAIVFGSAIRLSEEKNPQGLLEAFATVVQELPQAVLVIAGDGHLRETLIARVNELGVNERVRLVGARNDLEHFYSMLDVFVLPSRTEGLPLALLEAMATSKPIVATAVGHVPTVLADLRAEVVAPNDGEALAKAMVLAAQQMHHAGLRQRVTERYSVAHMAQSYAHIYRTFGVARGLAAA
jgi:glycosyltransferase involved in cell wall biosynthesis